MEKFSLQAMARELLERARGGSGGRAAATVIGGHERVLRQTVIAMVKGASLGEHGNPGEASVHVPAGRFRLSAGQHSCGAARQGDLLVVPDSSHSLQDAGGSRRAADGGQAPRGCPAPPEPGPPWRYFFLPRRLALPPRNAAGTSPCDGGGKFSPEGRLAS